MSKLDLLKFIQSFDGEISEADFTADELEYISNMSESELDLFKQKYKSYYDDIKYTTDKKQDW